MQSFHNYQNQLGYVFKSSKTLPGAFLNINGVNHVFYRKSKVKQCEFEKISFLSSTPPTWFRRQCLSWPCKSDEGPGNLCRGRPTQAPVLFLQSSHRAYL